LRKVILLIKWFKDLKKDNIAFAGGKGANLGELINAGMPVPDGFVVSASTFKDFLDETDLSEEIYEILKEIDVNNSDDLRSKAEIIKKMIRSAKMPADMKKEIVEVYDQLSEGEIIIAGTDDEPGAYVAVRSSATAEDLPDASFAGQQKTLLNVRGKTQLIEAVQDCWASLFEPRAIFYRENKGFEHEKVLISAIIQKMVDSEKSGVMFTVEPTKNDKTKISIEGSWGLGEAIVGGEVTPDYYLVDKKSLGLIDKRISSKGFMYTRDVSTGKTVRVDIDTEKANEQCLTTGEVKKIAEFGKKIEAHYDFPQDIEWAIEDGEIYILQSRPITTYKEGDEKAEEEFSAEGLKELIKGFGVSPGVGKGKVMIIHGADELSKVKEGDILVTEMTDPDMVPAMKRAAAIVTNEGGTTCHAAIVSRELGIPCIVGTGNATEVLHEGQEVTVDSSNSIVYEGIVAGIKAKNAFEFEGEVPETKTHVYVNLGIPEKAEEIAKLPADGVGLMREEFIFASLIGEHPLAMIARGDQQKFIDALAEGIAQVARAFNPRPVVLRLSDFKTNEYRSLKGGEEYEGEEDNPMLGWRGCSRYTSEKYKDAFKLELKAVKKVRDELGLKNLWVMLPFVRKVSDVTSVLRMLEEEGIQRGDDFKVWMMAEVPCNVILVDEFAKLVDGFSIGSNDLTQLVLGVDRDSRLLAKMGYFDERDPAVKEAIRQIIKGAHAAGKTVSICGQAPSVYDDFAEFLIEEGIDSISLNPDTVVAGKIKIAEIEKRIGGDTGTQGLGDLEEEPKTEAKPTSPTSPASLTPEEKPTPNTQDLTPSTPPEREEATPEEIREAITKEDNLPPQKNWGPPKYEAQ